MAEWVQTSVDVILSISAEGKSRASPSRSQIGTRVSGLVHGGQSVNVAVVKPEDRVERRSGDDGHITANEDMNTTMDTFQQFRGRVESATGEVIQGSLSTTGVGVLQPLVIGTTCGDGAEPRALWRLAVSESVAEERVVDGLPSVGCDDRDPLLLQDIRDARAGATGGPIPVRDANLLGGSKVFGLLITITELVGDGHGFTVEHLLEEVRRLNFMQWCRKFNYLDQEQIGTVPGKEDRRRVSAVADTWVYGGRIRVLPWLERQAVNTSEFEPAEFPVLGEIHQSIEREDEHVEGIGLLSTHVANRHAVDDTSTTHTGNGGECSGFIAISTLEDVGGTSRGDRDQVVHVWLFGGSITFYKRVESILGDGVQSLGVFFRDAFSSIWMVSIFSSQAVEAAQTIKTIAVRRACEHGAADEASARGDKK